MLQTRLKWEDIKCRGIFIMIAHTETGTSGLEDPWPYRDLDLLRRQRLQQEGQRIATI